MSKTRGERRDIKERKWISKLRKLWNTHILHRVDPVKTPKHRYRDLEDSETFDEFKNDKTGVLYKNTGTIYKCKNLSISDEHKRNKMNKSISKEDLEDIDEMIEQQQQCCGYCDNNYDDNDD